MRIHSLIVILTACLLAGAARAAAPLFSPEESARQYLADIRANGVGVIASHTHPDDLARFKSSMLPVFAKSPGGAMIRHIYGNSATLGSITTMPAERFFEKFMQVTGKSMKDYTFKTFEVLGSVREGATVHVVVRNNADIPGGVPVHFVHVMSLRQDGTTWKMLLSAEVDNLSVYMLRQ
jgi:hypothetical protein